MAAEFKAGAACDTVLDAPGVGRGRDELLAAIRARPSLVSTPPAEVTVGSRTGLMLDVRLTPSWTGGCVSPAGPIVGAPILHGAGTPGPVVGVNPDVPVRLVFVDLAAGHTLAVVIFGTTPSPSASFETQASVAMPIVSSFDLRPSTP
jgi:hypothetical protein